VQTPPEHTCPAAHTLVHDPQCCGSVWKLVQNALAPEPQPFGVEAGHAQDPPEHSWPIGQAFPQVPQLSASVESEAQ